MSVNRNFATCRGWRARKRLAVLLMIALVASTPGGRIFVLPTVQAQAPSEFVGAGFQLNEGDLRFVYRQIQIAESHSMGGDWGPGALLALVGNDPRLPFGLRTVDGSLNHLVPGTDKFGAADQVFPRMAPPQYRTGDASGDYAVPGETVVDSHPRIASNLIVDQSPRNPAAVQAGGGEGAYQTDPSGSILITNSAPDGGLSAPFNSMFTFFGQFFDHGLDLVTKGGGSVIIPLREDDPLVLGPDGELGTADDLPPQLRFMPFSRATTVRTPGPDGVLNTPDDWFDAVNTTTPFVDQNQTYTSHPSHQVFLRDYVMDGGRPLPTGRLIDGPGGHIANWGEVKEQARTMLGIALTDLDALSVPKLRADPYGHFVPGPNGFPQIETADGLLEGDPTANGGAGVAIPANAVRTGHQFLDDIAHNAAPVSSTGAALTPDSDDLVDPIGVPRPAGTYDDELLAAHFVTGDGRGNENIALTAVHTVFHSEHNRLASNISSLIGTPAAPGILTAAEVAAWYADNRDSGGWTFGERLFQAARFVTEMQYQHLVFEEFARKVQPNINPFIGDGINFIANLNPAIVAEFAHTVYRFGHSMLRDVVARTDGSGGDDSITLIDAFLNPLEFSKDGTITAAQAAGRIFEGGARQVGNEIDEFITEALRNNLLGLPLDLATINMTRGRSEGIPPLNAVRAVFYNASGNSALLPYGSWTEFGENIRHPESLVNFIAAYGVHATLEPTFDPDDAGPLVAGTLAARREAARVLTSDPSFMFGAAATTGVDAIDYWTGGLAEKQSPFGGLLGSTFNYVFETQLESLQNGDRFYYLERLDGLNLLSQLEANSFAELIQRNTSARGLPADIFSRPDTVFNVGNLAGTPQNSRGISDDPTTEENEMEIAELRRNGGTFIYSGPLHVLWNGTEGADGIVSSEGDDTLQGLGGNDRMEGGSGNDQAIGGEGDDIITDTFGDDVLKGGPGDDAISGGPGLDLLQGNDGNDFIVAGIDLTEVFGGQGNDIIYMGAGLSESIGGAGDDWMEGTDSPASIAIGDDNNQFQDDPNGGHDILLAGPGDMDFDSEGGDDTMVGTVLPTHRFEGMLGFDYVTYRGDPLPVDADMDIGIATPPTANELRDRFDLTEALSGWNQNDILRGDSRLDVDMTGGHELTAAGARRVTGMSEFILRMTGLDVSALADPVVAWASGNILLGGLGSDVIEGRGGNDLIDGDAWLNVQLRAPVPGSTTGETQLVNSLHQIKADVFAGRIHPNSISFERSLVGVGLPGVPGAPAPTVPAADCDAAAPLNCDTAVFTGPQSEYAVSRNANGTITVEHSNGGVDGIDILYNIEQLRFADVTVPAPPLGTLSLSTQAPVEDSILTVTADIPGASNLSLAFQAEVAGVFTQVATGAIFTPTDAQVGQRLRVVATFDTSEGPGTITSSPTAAVAGVNDVPTGQPAIDDTTPAVGQTLSALTAGIADPDGLGPFGYQWLANDGIIPGATGVTYIPTTAGVTLRVRVSWTDQQGFAEAVTSAATSPVSAAPTGGGAAAAIVAMPTSLDFGGRRVNSTNVRRVDVSNTGTAPLTVTTVVSSGAPFTITANTCTTAVAPGRRCRIDVTFVPTAATLYSGTVTVTSNAVNSPTLMNLSGSGRAR